MLKFAHIYADNALFLQSSKLTVRGEANPGKAVCLTLKNEVTGELLCSVGGEANANGNFYLDINTPAASFDTYELAVSCGDEVASARGILFGELWLASGQSNMELSNVWCSEFDEMLEFLKDKPIRTYHIGNKTADAIYSREPLEDYEGAWADGSCEDVWRVVSASATSFAKELYLYFLSIGESVPIGFVNSSRGAANIECWIPESAALASKSVSRYLKECDLYPTDENYNKKGDMNYRQVGSYYNFKIHPTIGLKYRGILWYQGESNIETHATHGNYSELLKLFRDSLKPIFAKSADAPFPLIASQLYPWAFSSCNMGYLNLSISALARKHPREFSFLPVCDMSSIWSFQTNNHPIHPTCKYEHGARFAKIAENMIYGRGGARSQKAPATLRRWHIEGNKIILEFKNVGSGLYVKGTEVRGLYIRSEKSVYTKAYAEIIGKNKLAVSHPYVEKPIHVAYAVASFEHYVNLYAGEFPVAPFATEVNDITATPKIDIKIKNWLYPELDSEVYILEGDRNVFPRAVFLPSEGSEIGFDSDYALSSRSVRIRGGEDGFGCYLLSHKLREFDLENYSELRFSALNSKGLEVSLRLYYEESCTEEGENIENIIHNQGSVSDDPGKKALSAKADASAESSTACGNRGNVVVLSAKKLREYRSSWCDLSVDLTALPPGKIERMEFFFRISEENHLRTTANIDKLILIPKQ